MIDNIPDAPWIGLHKEDTKRTIGYCYCCGKVIYEDDVYDCDYDGDILDLICEDCYSKTED